MKKCMILCAAILALVLVLSGCQDSTLTLDKTELNMTVGDSVALSAGNAAKVHWVSSDDSVATVNAGTVSAKSAGTATITASLESGAAATCTVTVTDKLIETITLSATSTRVEVGKTIQLSATYSPADASQHALSWASADSSVASVDANGYVTGVAEGKTTVSCRSENGVEASCTVTVGGAAEPPTTTATLPPATEKPAEKATESASSQSSSSQSDDSVPSRKAPSGGAIFPDSSTHYLSQGEIAETLSSQSGVPVADSFAQDAINEIYARNGYIFRTPGIRAYYEAQSWYRPDPNYDGSLNEIEQYNIGLLSQY